MYQGYGQTELLPVAMMGPRQWFARCLSLSCRFGTRTTNPCSAKRDGKMRDGVKTGDTGSTAPTTWCRRHGERDRRRRPDVVAVALQCVKTEASVTEKERVERCSVHCAQGTSRAVPGC
jgi:hypothetical protein